MSTRIIYGDEIVPKKRASNGGGGKKQKIKASTDVCPVSYIVIAPAASNRREVCVGDKIVPVFGNKLVEKLAEVGITPPFLPSYEPFDIVSFLKKTAEELAVLPVDEINGKWERLTFLAERLGIETSFIQHIRSNA